MTLSRVEEVQTRHFRCLCDLGSEEPLKLINRARELKQEAPATSGRKTIATAFFNHNPRSLLFLRDAITRLGHRHVHFNAARSSIAKGESLHNTFHTLRLIGVDVVVARGLGSNRIPSAKRKGPRIVNVSGMSDAKVVDKLRNRYGDHSGSRSPNPDKVRIIATRFSEKSTRTLLSFQMAIVRLGYHYVDLSRRSAHPEMAEQLRAAVVRHKRPMRELLSYPEAKNVPVINAGSGTEAHPTQALADLITIKERLGRIEGIKVAIIGDVLHSRVANSLMIWLDRLGASVSIAGPREMLPPASGRVKRHTDLNEAVAEARIAYVLRPQFERHGDRPLISREEYAKRYMFGTKQLELLEPNDGFVMHAGPINEGVDISAEVAQSARSLIDEQVRNGVFARMAVLKYVLGEMD